MISYIIKRDGRRESFDLDKIANAVFRAAQSVGGTDAAMARDVAEKTCALYEQLPKLQRHIFYIAMSVPEIGKSNPIS